MADQSARNIETLQVPRWGAVVHNDGVVPWLVLDDAGAPVEPIRQFLLDFVAQGNREWSVRSYAYDLLRWWRWLTACEIGWQAATSAESRDLVLWMIQTTKPRSTARTRSLPTAGTVNLITGKRYLDDRYSARTIRHHNAVVRAFYGYWIERGEGPLLNPVPVAHGSERINAHRSPQEPVRPGGRLRYNPKLPGQRPRAIPDARWDDMFAVLRCHRDRALLAVAISNGARAQEVLGITPIDIDWGDQLVRVVRKGTRVRQWLPVSAEAMVWLRLYIAETDDDAPANESVWRTRRRSRAGSLDRRPLSYDGLRKVLTRANEELGTNWTMHDLRHTAALRMARDNTLSARDIQTILGHAHLSTTTDTYLVEDHDAIIERVLHHLDRRRQHSSNTVSKPADGYDTGDLSVLFGETAPS